MHRYELTDQQWARIEPFLPHRTHHGNLGHPFNDHRPIINGILWILHTGAPWRDLPERYSPWETAYYRFNRWRRDGTWIRIVASLLDELDDRGQIDHDLWCIDGSVIRASRAAAGAKKKRRAARVAWEDEKRRNWRNRQTMRWDVPEVGSAPRSTWCVTATASSSPST